MQKGTKYVCNIDPQEPFPLEMHGLYSPEEYKAFVERMDKALKSVNKLSYFSFLIRTKALNPIIKVIGTTFYLILLYYPVLYFYYLIFMY